MAKAEIKVKTCPECGTEFVPYRSTQRVCNNYKCALANVRRKEKERAQKQERKWIRKRKEEIKTKPQLIAEAQREFNKFIRLRDEINNQPCIDCGQHGEDNEDWLSGGKWDAGHYLSVGSHPELRFDVDNCHRQLKSCNAGNSRPGRKSREQRTISQRYRENLIKRIGLESVERLEGPHDMPNWSKDDLREIKKYYQDKARELKKQREVA